MSATVETEPAVLVRESRRRAHRAMRDLYTVTQDNDHTLVEEVLDSDTDQIILAAARQIFGYMDSLFEGG